MLKKRMMLTYLSKELKKYVHINQALKTYPEIEIFLVMRFVVY